MPKIRGIKPEVWTDEKFVSVSPYARLLFIGMWNFMCDNGHIADSAIQLKMRILPGDPCDVAPLVDELVSIGLLERVDGWLKSPTLSVHQRPDKRYLVYCERCRHDEQATYIHPEWTPSPTSTHGAPHEGTTSTRGGHATEGDGDGDGESKQLGSKLYLGAVDNFEPSQSRRAS